MTTHHHNHHRLSADSGTRAPPRIALQDHSQSWTDDLPVCHLSGVGFSTNQIYREDGNRREEHEFEDRSFHFRTDDQCQLYGVFDGHGGVRASSFATQKMPAELLLGQLDQANTDTQVKEVLHQAFIAVEKGFFESIDEVLAERTTLQLQLPEGISEYDACTLFPSVVNRLRELDMEICSGTAVVLALVFNGKLHVANIGNSRALLCKMNNDKVLRVIQLSVDHTVSNDDELFRLSQLGLPVEQVKNCSKLGHQVYTRCIGDYTVKGGYKDIENLRSAVSEPVIAEPDISGDIAIDETCSFLILMSDGLYKSLEDATSTEHVNAEIASMVASEMGVQTTLNGVSQAVVDKIVRIHHDKFMTGDQNAKHLCGRRDDMTLLVRNFNFPLANSVGSPTIQNTVTGSVFDRALFNAKHPQMAGSATLRNATHSSTLQNSSTYTSSNDSAEEQRSLMSRNRSIRTPLVLDADGRITAYVDFSEFYKALEELTESQRASLDKDTEPPPPLIDTISEEDDSQHRDSVDSVPNDIATDGDVVDGNDKNDGDDSDDEESDEDFTDCSAIDLTQNGTEDDKDSDPDRESVV